MHENGCEGSYGAPSVPASPAAPSRDAAEGTTNPKTLSGSPTKGALAADAHERAEGAGEAAGPAAKAPGSAEGGEGGTEGGEEGTEGDGAPAKPVATLYVGNLPPEASEGHLMAIFYPFGPISTIQACACICHRQPQVRGTGFGNTSSAAQTVHVSACHCHKLRLLNARTQGRKNTWTGRVLVPVWPCCAISAAGSDRVPTGSGLHEARR